MATPRVTSKKHDLIELILKDLNQDIEVLTLSAKAAYEAATHEESKAEDSHDTRGLEASYLAGAQIARIENLKKVRALFQFSNLRTFNGTDGIETGALIELSLDAKKFYYLLMALGGGMSVKLDNQTVQVITPQSPLGEALLGKHRGDIFEIESKNQIREYEVISIE